MIGGINLVEVQVVQSGCPENGSEGVNGRWLPVERNVHLRGGGVFFFGISSYISGELVFMDGACWVCLCCQHSPV